MARYAFSDLHGQLKLYQQIKEFVKPEDQLYCLGDCGDRGPQSWETVKAIIDDPQVICLKGNHEDMLIGAMLEHLSPEEARDYQEDYDTVDITRLLFLNGGEDTYQGWLDEGAKREWVDKLKALPTIVTLESDDKTVILTHAGFTPLASGEIPDDFDLMWSRYHLDMDWGEYEGADKIFIVHGHTPCPSLYRGWSPSMGAITYADGHKIDIDMGAFSTNFTCLLNLDTFEEHIFFRGWE